MVVVKVVVEITVKPIGLVGLAPPMPNVVPLMVVR
jgi:hypothetical protein